MGSPFESEIRAECEALADMLVEKNRLYGNSAIEPLRVFSSVDQLEQIRVRMDDKLSRIRRMSPEDSEDAYLDLAGYLILYLAVRRTSSS
jgi:hypothetical protein